MQRPVNTRPGTRNIGDWGSGLGVSGHGVSQRSRGQSVIPAPFCTIHRLTHRLTVEVYHNKSCQGLRKRAGKYAKWHGDMYWSNSALDRNVKGRKMKDNVDLTVK
jgi:hypothetical protein